MIDILVRAALTLFLPPLLLGVINKTKALFAGRKGAPFVQPYRDIFKLLRKGIVVSRTAGWTFWAGPAVGLASVACASVLMPLGGAASPIAFAGDMVLFAYLLGLGRFFTASAALDTGSAFEGMGASREVTFAAITEPALFLAFLALARMTGSLSLSGMFGGGAAAAFAPSIVLLAVGLFAVLLAETCRIPVDDPNTHLELTMIHEAMVLDHSGPLLGTILYSAAMKLFVLGAALLGAALPFRVGVPWADWALFVGELLALAAVIGVAESVMARLRMRRVPYLLVAALLLCGSALMLLLR